MRNRSSARVQAELDGLETEFRAKLVGALERCAAGEWGLFDHNAHLDLPGDLEERMERRSGAAGLLVLGQEIEELRHQLGIGEPFALFARFLALRGRCQENDPGEPKRAAAWLKELRSAGNEGA